MSFSPKLLMLLFLSSLLIHESSAGIVCEDLRKDVCAFAIASSGKRCVLETARGRDGSTEYECKTSEVVVERMSDYIETDQCVKACGVDRNSVGISSDDLMEPQLTAKLCSPPCYQRCPNIADLYFNLAAGEGVFLGDLCEKQRRKRNRRAMLELTSFGGGAPDPISKDPNVIASPPLAPAPSPLSQPDDVVPSPAPSPYDVVSSPAPSPDDVVSSPAPSPYIDDVVSSPAPSPYIDDVVPSPALAPSLF